MSGLNFSTLIDELRGAMVAPDELPAIWGGEFSAGRLQAFLAAWTGRGDLPWRVWEWVSDMQIMHGASAPPANLQWLERGRLFGDGGDLTLRRDGERFMWHFVGPHASPLPQRFCLGRRTRRAGHCDDKRRRCPPISGIQLLAEPSGQRLASVRAHGPVVGPGAAGNPQRPDAEPGRLARGSRGGRCELVYPTMSGQA